jgi:FKBP-type peptidyl-prolyl cis-trans isomerase FklB
MNKVFRLFALFITLSLLTLSTACGKKETAEPEKAAPQASQQTAEAPTPDATEKAGDTVPHLTVASYNFGMQMGAYVKQNLRDNYDMDALIEGLRDGAASKTPRYTKEQMEAAIAFLNEQQEKKMAEEKTRNLEAGKQFLAENAKREGIKTTESGLQYEVITAVAEGKSPAATDVVKTHYHGTLTDGTVFDSSYERGEPIEFPLNRVIPGWTEALQLMKVGEKFRIYVPHNLAYGEAGRPPQIPGNAVLVFDIELLGFGEE